MAGPEVSSDDDDEFVFLGTALQDEEETRGGARRKDVVDASAARALPVWKQEVTDEEGRRRLHGAFTGGFSAGYFNTVGSAVGWEPSTFKSSRADRSKFKTQSLDDFLDEDELEERRKTALTVKSDYDTFGAAATAAARAEAAREATTSRPSAIPGAMMEELVTPVASGIGTRLLQCMGWRAGKGIGTASSAQACDVAGSKWGTVSGVSLENTPIYVLQPKHDVHGLGYDPFRDAEEFRQYKRHKKETEGGPGRGRGPGGSRGEGAGGSGRRGPGVAFGTGVFDDTDTLGYMDDYYDEADHETGGANRSSGFALLQSGKPDESVLGRLTGSTGAAGTRALALTSQGFNYELALSDEDEDDRGGRGGRGRAREPLRLQGAEEKLMLQSSQQLRKGGDFISAFIKSNELLVFQHYEAPVVPASFVERHVFPPEADLSAGGLKNGAGASLLPPPPEVPPPTNPALLNEIDSLAALVARSGKATEDLARRQATVAAAAATAAAAAAAAAASLSVPGADVASAAAAAAAVASKAPVPGNTPYSFLLGGPGAEYYAWRLQKLKVVLEQEQAKDGMGQLGPTSEPSRVSVSAGAAGQKGSRPGAAPHPGPPPRRLTVEERLALLGEAPLPPKRAAAPPGPSPGGPSNAQGSTAPRQSSAVQPAQHQIAAGDKRMLHSQLMTGFVKGERQDMAEGRGGREPSSSLVGGLRPGAGSKLGAPSLTGAAAAAMASFADRFTSGSTAATSVLLPEQGGARSMSAAVQEQWEKERQQKELRPVRHSEEWRPEPLLCRRLNVPDPYQGVAKEATVSRFKTDHFSLPETAACMIAAAATAAASSTGAGSDIAGGGADGGPDSGTAGLPLPPPPPLPATFTPGAAAAGGLPLPPPPPLPVPPTQQPPTHLHPHTTSTTLSSTPASHQAAANSDLAGRSHVKGTPAAEAAGEGPEDFHVDAKSMATDFLASLTDGSLFGGEESEATAVDAQPGSLEGRAVEAQPGSLVGRAVKAGATTAEATKSAAEAGPVAAGQPTVPSGRMQYNSGTIKQAIPSTVVGRDDGDDDNNDDGMRAVGLMAVAHSGVNKSSSSQAKPLKRAPHASLHTFKRRSTQAQEEGDDLQQQEPVEGEQRQAGVEAASVAAAPKDEQQVLNSLDKPLDLFKAIFEADESDDDDDDVDEAAAAEEEEEGVDVGSKVDTEVAAGVKQHEASATGRVGGEASSLQGPAGSVEPAQLSGLAGALLRAQQLAAEKARDSRRATETPGTAPGPSLPSHLGGPADARCTSGHGALGPVQEAGGPPDSAVQQRIVEALSRLRKAEKKDKRKKGKGKDSKRKRKREKGRGREQGREKDKREKGKRRRKHSSKEASRSKKRRKEEKAASKSKKSKHRASSSSGSGGSYSDSDDSADSSSSPSSGEE